MNLINAEEGRGMLVMQINYVNYAPRTVSIRFGWMQKLHAMRDRKHDTKLMTRPAAARRSPGAGDTVMIQWPLTQLDPTYFDLLCWLDYSIRSLGLCYCPTWPLPCPHNDRRGTTRGIWPTLSTMTCDEDSVFLSCLDMYPIIIIIIMK